MARAPLIESEKAEAGGLRLLTTQGEIEGSSPSAPGALFIAPDWPAIKSVFMANPAPVSDQPRPPRPPPLPLRPAPPARFVTRAAPATALPPPRQVSDRWTPLLAGLGWTPIVDFFLDNYHRLPRPLKYAEAMFVIHLMQYKWDAGAPFPSLSTIARKMGISAQAARSYARSLERKEYLFREMQIGETNRFHLKKLFDALERLASQDEKARQRQNAREVSGPIIRRPFGKQARRQAPPKEQGSEGGTPSVGV